MAVIKYSGLVDQLRGKLNGTVFSKFHEGFNSYKKGQPTRWGTDDQQMLRKSFYQGSQFWSSMAQVNRDNWNYVASQVTVPNRLGDQVHITGYAYFMRFWQYKAFTVGTDNGWVYDTLEPAPPFILSSTPLVAEITGLKHKIKSLTVTIQLTADAETWSFVPIYLSNPIRTEGGKYSGTKYLVGSIYVDKDTPSGTILSQSFADVVLSESWHVYPDHYADVYARSVTSFTGRETPLQAVRITETLEHPPQYLDYTITLSPYTYGKIWDYTQASYPVPVWTDIRARGTLNKELEGSGSDYEIITDVALTGQTSTEPDEDLWALGYKTIITTPEKNLFPNPLTLQIWPPATMVPALNTAPLVTLSAEPTYLTVRYRMRRLSDGLETVPVFATVNPNYPV